MVHFLLTLHLLDAVLAVTIIVLYVLDDLAIDEVFKGLEVLVNRALYPTDLGSLSGSFVVLLILVFVQRRDHEQVARRLRARVFLDVKAAAQVLLANFDGAQILGHQIKLLLLTELRQLMTMLVEGGPHDGYEHV